MPTVPIEQNRVGLAGVTDARLRAGDYGGTGLQALGAGLRTLGDTGAKVADDAGRRRERGTAPDESKRGSMENAASPRSGQPHPGSSSDGQGTAMAAHEQDHVQTLRDDAESKQAWNDYAAVSRAVTAALGELTGFDAIAAIPPAAAALAEAFDQGRARLTTDRQRGIYDRSVAPRLDLDKGRLQALKDRQTAVEQDRQSGLVQRNSADDAVLHADDPDLFGKYLATGEESIAHQAALRGQDAAVTAPRIAAWRSGVHRRVADGLVAQDPVAAATWLQHHRGALVPADLSAVTTMLREPLARAQAAADVDGLAPPRPAGDGEPPPIRAELEARRQAIEAQDWTEARKQYARDDVARRLLTADRQRNQAADAAKEAAIAAADRLGPDFRSITQIAPTVRRDMDAATEAALERRAARNLDPTPIAPHGQAALTLNLMATQMPDAFAREDLRLSQGLVTPEEYDRFVRLQQGMGGYPPAGDAVTQGRIADGLGQQEPGLGRNGAAIPSPAAHLVPASYLAPPAFSETDTQADHGASAIDNAPPQPNDKSTAKQAGGTLEAGKAPGKSIFDAPKGPSAVLSGFVKWDPALQGLVAASTHSNLATLERTYEHTLQGAAHIETKLRKAITERKDQATLEKLRQDIAARRAKAAAVEPALIPAMKSQRALESYFIGKGVNIVLGTPAENHGNVQFDDQGKVRFAEGATSSTYVIRGPDYQFANPDDAAFDAIALTRAAAGAAGDGRERTGYIIRRADGTYGYEYPYPLVGRGQSISRISSSGVDLNAPIDWPPGNAVAMWHIHPVGGEGDNVKNVYFGEGDIEAPWVAAKRIAAPTFAAYLGASDGGVRVVRNVKLYSETLDGGSLKKSAYELVGPGYFRLR
jgi:hypothetical protein